MAYCCCGDCYSIVSLLSLLYVQVTIYDCCITAFNMCCLSFSQHFHFFFYCILYSPCGNLVTDKTEVLLMDDLMFLKWKMELFDMFI